MFSDAYVEWAYSTPDVRLMASLAFYFVHNITSAAFSRIFDGTVVKGADIGVVCCFEVIS